MRYWGCLLLLTIAGPASAAPIEYCVRDTAEFNRAWRAADADPVIIKMAVGTYNMQGSCVDKNFYCRDPRRLQLDLQRPRAGSVENRADQCGARVHFRGQR